MAMLNNQMSQLGGPGFGTSTTLSHELIISLHSSGRMGIVTVKFPCADEFPKDKVR